MRKFLDWGKLLVILVLIFACQGIKEAHAAGEQILFMSSDGAHVFLKDGTGQYYVNGQKITNNNRITWKRELHNSYVGGSFSRTQTIQLINDIGVLDSVNFVSFKSEYAGEVPNAFLLNVRHVLMSNAVSQFSDPAYGGTGWRFDFTDVFGLSTPRYTHYDGNQEYPLDGDMYLVVNADNGQVVDFVSKLNPYYYSGAEKAEILEVKDGATNLQPPTGQPQLNISTVKGDSVTISWESIPYGIEYEVEHGDNTITSNSNSITLNDLLSDTSGQVRVRAVNSMGQGPWSDYINYKTKLTTPVVTHAVTSSTLQINWDAVNGANSYEVEIDGVVTSVGNATEFIMNNVVPNKEYIYKVRAVSAGNESDWSVEGKVTIPFSKPLDISTTSLFNSITLSWTAVSGATAYDVELNGAIKTSVSSATARINGLSPNTDYDIRVRAKKGTNIGEWSDAATVKTLLSTPVITNVPSDTEITLNWAEIAGATSYEVEADGVVVSANGLSYTHTGLVSGTTHKYRVRAKSDVNVSDWSTLVTTYTVPGKVGVVTGAPTSTTIVLSWPTVPGATRYDVERNGVVVVSPTGASTTLSGLQPDQDYTIRVRAKNTGGNGDWSDSLVVKTQLATPVVTKAAAETEITLSWAEIAGATAYEVEADGVVVTVTGTGYTHTGLNPGTAHTYKVRAKSDTNVSVWSAVVNANTVPSKPGVITGTATSNRLVLSWPVVPGATKYDVERNGTIVTSPTTATVTLSSLQPNQDYTIRVRAKNAGGDSEWSDAATVKTLLSTPVITNVPSDTEITLNWAEIAGATSYEVEADGVVVSASGLSYTHTGLASGTTHKYRVRAKSDANVSDWSTLVTTYTVPGKVGVLTGAPTSTTIVLSWPTVSGATRYDVERNGVVVVSPTGASTTLSGLQPDQDYTIRVRAKNTGGNGDWSDSLVVKTQLATPVVTKAAAETEITLSWAAVAGATAYEVEADGVVVTVTGTEYTHTGLNPGTAHTYKVRAKSDTNVSVWSAVVNANTVPSKPGVITGTATSNRLVLSWPVVPGATKYDVERNGTIVTSPTTATVTLSSLQPNQDYTIRVRAKNAGGDSEWSDAVTVKTLLSTPVITNVPSDTEITLNWAEIAGATSYEVEADGVVVSANGLSYTHTGLVSGTTHKYRVRAKSDANVSDWSTLVTTYTVPGKVGVVTGAPTSTTIVLSWPTVSGATRYDVERNGVVVVSPTGASTTLSGLQPDQDYTIRVRAKNTGGNGDWSDSLVVKTQLATPVVTKAAAETEITLSWAEIAGATAYEVEADGVVVTVAGTGYTHTGLNPGTAHTYKVRAKSDTNVSVWSAVVNANTVPSKPGVITGTATSNRIVLSWPAVPGATKYDVERNGTIVVTPTTATATLSSLQPDQDYTIRVRAKNAGGDSEWSDPFTFRTTLSAPTITVTSGVGENTITWSAIGNASEYELDINGQFFYVGNQQTYIHTGLVKGVRQTYRIRAISGVSLGDWSSYVTKAAL